jgi:prophage antirepressor-like protein
MNNLIVFDEREVLGKEFRMYGTKENPLFLAKDVANWIEHSSITMMLKKIDEDEKVKVRPKQSLGLLTNNNEYWFLTEGGLYEVLMQSRKPIAKAFKKEVKQILKQIRQTGGYIPVSQEDDEKLILAKALMITKRTIEQKEQLLQQANRTIEQQKPLVELAKDFLDKDGLISVDDFAKNLAIKDLGRNNMYKYLREQKILMTDEWENHFTLKKMYGENHHKPYSRFINEGKMVWKPTSYNNHTDQYNYKPYFTVQGVEYMIKRLKKDGFIK